MVNKKFEILLLQNLKTALNYTLDSLLTLDTLRVRNIIILLKSEIDKTIETLRNENRNEK